MGALPWPIVKVSTSGCAKRNASCSCWGKKEMRNVMSFGAIGCVLCAPLALDLAGFEVGIGVDSTWFTSTSIGTWALLWSDLPQRGLG